MNTLVTLDLCQLQTPLAERETSAHQGGLRLGSFLKYKYSFHLNQQFRSEQIPSQDPAICPCHQHSVLLLILPLFASFIEINTNQSHSQNLHRLVQKSPFFLFPFVCVCLLLAPSQPPYTHPHPQNSKLRTGVGGPQQ